MNANVVEHPAQLRSTPEQAARACIRVISRAIATRIDVLLESLDDELIDRADAAQSEELREPYFRTVQFLRRQAEDIRDAFTNLTASGDGGQGARAASEEALDEDQQLALDTMVRRFERNSGTRLGRLREALGAPALKAPADVQQALANLTEPRVIALTWAQGVAGLDVASGMRLILLKRFEREVLHELGPALEEAAALLESAQQNAAREGNALGPAFDPEELAAPPSASVATTEPGSAQLGTSAAETEEFESRRTDSGEATFDEADSGAGLPVVEDESAEALTVEDHTGADHTGGNDGRDLEAADLPTAEVTTDEVEIGDVAFAEVDADEFDVSEVDANEVDASEVDADEFELLDDEDIGVDTGDLRGSSAEEAGSDVPLPEVDEAPSKTTDGVAFGATDIPGELISDWSDDARDDEFELSDDEQDADEPSEGVEAGLDSAEDAGTGPERSLGGLEGEASGDSADKPLPGLVDEIQARLLVRLRELELGELPQPLDLGGLLVRALQGAAGADAALSDRAAAIVSLVQALYDEVLADEDLGVPLRALLARTQLPMLRQALADPSVLTAQDHALRTLLDVCIAAAVDFTGPQTLQREPVLRAVLGTLDALADAPDSPPEHLDGLREELVIIVEREAEKIERVTRRTFTNELARIEADITRTEVSRLIEQRANYIDDRGLMKFIEHDWQLVLFRIRQAKGVASREWRDALRVLCRLTRGSGIQGGELHQALIDGLRYLGRSDENATRDATAALTKMIENDGQGSGPAPAVKLPPESDNAGQAAQETEEEVSAVEGIPIGRWLVLPEAGGSPRRGRLAGASSTFDVCVIVDGRGRLTETLARDEFAQGVAAGTIRVLDVTRRFERALDALSE